MNFHPEQIQKLTEWFKKTMNLSDRDARRVAIGTLKQESEKPSKITPLNFDESYKQ